MPRNIDADKILKHQIPVQAIKDEIAGINFADQCDQATSYDFRLRNVLKEVLYWTETPAYRERLEKVLKRIPNADVEPMTQSCWVKVYIVPMGDRIKCCECQEMFGFDTESGMDYLENIDLDLYRPHYCPNCGAKMESEENETK